MAVVAIFIGLYVMTQGQIMIFFRQKSLVDMFQPGMIQFETAGDAFSAECTYDDTSGKFWYQTLTLHISSITFPPDPQKKEPDTIQFLVLLSMGEGIYEGEVNGDPHAVLACTREDGDTFKCQQEVTIKFWNIMVGKNPSDVDYVHISAWRNTKGVQDEMNAADVSFSKLLDDQYPSYLGSTGLKGEVTMARICADTTCESCAGVSCTQSACQAHPFCWYNPPLGIGLFPSGQCSACVTTTCTNMNQDACTRCAAHSNCHWAVTQCVENNDVCAGLEQQECIAQASCWWDTNKVKCSACGTPSSCASYSGDPDACTKCIVPPNNCKTQTQANGETTCVSK